MATWQLVGSARARRRWLGAALALTAAPRLSAQPAPRAPQGGWHFIHNGPETASDGRYDYHWQVLRAALEATRADHGPYTLEARPHMNESRQLHEMQRRDGLLNTMVLDSTGQLERQLQPVRVPVDKGLLGYRVFLIRAADQPAFGAVRSLEELRRFSMGQGADWDDVQIYRAAGFRVVGASRYDSLFPMLMQGRFDALGRGVTEVEGELANFGPRHPGLVIESTLLIHYPLAVYFWFARSADGELRWQRVNTGMQRLVADGSLDRMFRQTFGGVVERLRLKQRRLFRLDNPLLPPGQPFNEKGWWFDPVAG